MSLLLYGRIFVDEDYGKLFVVTESGAIHQHNVLLQRNPRQPLYYSTTRTQVCSLPEPIIPVSTQHLRTCIRCHRGNPALHETPTPTFDAFRDYLQHFHPVYSTYLEHIFFQDASILNLLHHLRRGTAHVVSDGSFLPQPSIATAAFILCSDDHSNKVIGYCRLPERDNDNDSTRGEIFGLILSAVVLQAINSYFNINEGSIHIACDNDSAIYNGLEKDEWPSPSQSHFDLLSTLRRHVSKLPFVLHPHRVKGHQDPKRQHLTCHERLNVVADFAAKSYAYMVERQPTLQSGLQSDPLQWIVRLNGTLVKKDLTHNIQDFHFGTALMTHQRMVQLYGPTAAHHINWDAIATSTKGLSVRDSIWRTKLVS